MEPHSCDVCFAIQKQAGGRKQERGGKEMQEESGDCMRIAKDSERI